MGRAGIPAKIENKETMTKKSVSQTKGGDKDGVV